MATLRKGSQSKMDKQTTIAFINTSASRSHRDLKARLDASCSGGTCCQRQPLRHSFGCRVAKVEKPERETNEAHFL